MFSKEEWEKISQERDLGLPYPTYNTRAKSLIDHSFMSRETRGF